MSIDWKALLVGVGIAFSPIVIVATIGEWVGDLPVGALVERSVPDPVVYFFLLVGVGLFLGAFAAGYLHSPRLAGGVLYGVAAGVIGLVFPAVATIYLFAGLIGVLSGELGVLLTVSLLLAFALPILAGGVVVTGAVRGLLGALLRRRRST